MKTGLQDLADISLDQKRLELVAFSRQLREEYSQLRETSRVLRKESRELRRESKLLRTSGDSLKEVADEIDRAFAVAHQSS